jgi:hypothetical protein
LRQWQARDIWRQVHEAILEWLNDLDTIDWSRVASDSSTVRIKDGGEHMGPNPTDRSKVHMLVDQQGVYGSLRSSRGANVHDSNLLEPLVDAVHRPTGATAPRRSAARSLHTNAACTPELGG